MGTNGMDLESGSPSLASLFSGLWNLSLSLFGLLLSPAFEKVREEKGEKKTEKREKRERIKGRGAGKWE